MKKTTAFILTILYLISSASAHPGRTDSNGGHHVSGTSEYHYHHGYSAHQHPNGVCPYDFDDKTGQNSGSNSGVSTATTKGSATSTESSKDLKEKSKKSVWDYILIGFLIVVFGFPVLVLLASPVIAIVDNANEKKLKEAQDEEKKRRFNEERNNYVEQYTGKTIEELSDMPLDTEIGEDGLPKTKGSAGWGAQYTFYVSRQGKVFHCKPNCNAAVKKKIHACATCRYSPCKKCKPICPDLRWFGKYKHIKSICEFYQINLPVSKVERGPYWAILPNGEKLYASDPKTLRDKINKLTVNEDTEEME